MPSNKQSATTATQIGVETAAPRKQKQTRSKSAPTKRKRIAKPKPVKPDVVSSADDGLTDKQRAFVEAYLANGFNGVKAAKAAGYSGEYSTLGVTAHDNLKNPKISALIDRRITDLTMTANEVLYRLSQHARGDMGELANIQTAADLADHPLSWLVKEMERTIVHKGRGEDRYTEETIKLKLLDPQAAIVHLGKYHKLFVERHQVDDWRSQTIQYIRNGELDYESLVEVTNDPDLATQLFTLAGVAVSKPE